MDLVCLISMKTSVDILSAFFFIICFFNLMNDMVW